MNAQLNSTNFQQFVATNKGKNIMFKHTDEKNVSTDIIRYVVDVCADYFTFKYDESDAKIAGFYYYTECKMIEEKHPLISVLEKHNVSVLNLSIGLSCIFKYCDYDSLINGTCLTTSQPVGFHIDSIKEVWAMVDGKNTLVYQKSTQEFRNEMSLEDFLSSNKDVTIETRASVRFPNFKLWSINDSVIYGTSNEGPTIYSACINLKNIKRVLSKDGKELYVNKDFVDVEKDKKGLPIVNQMEPLNDELIKDKQQYKLVQAQPVAIGIQGTDECKAKKVEKQLDPEDEKIIEFLLTHHRGMTVYTKEKVYRDFEYLGSIKAEESTPFSRIIVMGNCNDIQIDIPLSNIHLVVRGQESYERGSKRFFEKQTKKDEVKFNVFKENVVEWEALVNHFYPKYHIVVVPDYIDFRRALDRVKTEGFSEELYKELVRCSDLLRERIVSKMRCNYIGEVIFKLSRKYAELINKIKKAVGDEPIDDLIEKINKKLETSKKTLQIEYRGKAKTVEVMNEYTHGNGKDYVLVKDITDNGKTKTLFKEYIKYM
jgi:hypothetical protein